MPDIRLQDYLAKLQTLIADDRHNDVIRHCQHILRQYPKHIATYGLLGEACLEMERYEEAVDLFHRTLSADPENLMARVGLSIIHTVEGAAPEAIWQMERAYELAPGNPEVRRELERLYAARDGEETSRPQLTRGALGRLYARNGLYERAITEFRSILRQDPDSADIRVSLAEALWREGRRLEAVETCLDLVQVLPNCLKANLILGEIWVRGGHGDAGEEKLSVARTLDPENLVAQEMMGRDSPLPLEDVYVRELEITPAVVSPSLVEPAGEVAVGMAAAATLSQAVDEGEGALSQVPGPPEEAYAVEELPAWLLELPAEVSGPEAEVAGALADLPEPMEDVPDWLMALAVTGTGDEPPVGPQPLLEEGLLVEGVAPSPVVEAAVEEVPKIEGYPDWLRGQDELSAAGAPLAAVETMTDENRPPDEEMLATGAPAEEELDGIVAPEAQETTAKQIQPADEVPEWVRELETSDDDEVLSGELLAAGAMYVPAAEPPQVETAPGETLPPWVRTLEAAVADAAPDVEAQAGNDGGPANEQFTAGDVDVVPREEPIVQGSEQPDKPAPQADADEEEEPATHSTRLDSLQTELEAQPGNYRARMELARRYRDAQEWDAAMAEYEELVSTRKLLPAVIEDLKLLTKEDVDPVQLYKLMGDAYTQADQPDEAQEMYRLARKALGKE